MEKYRLIFSGERCGEFTKLSISDHFKLIKLSPRAQEKYKLQGKLVLKSKLSQAQMIKNKAQLKKMGIITSHQLELSEELFERGIKPIKKEKDISLPVFKPSENISAPLIFSRPKKNRIKQLSNQLILSYETRNYQFGALLLIALALFLTLALQNYLVVLSYKAFEIHILATIIGIAFLCAGVAVMPRIFQPLQSSIFTIEKAQISLYEQPEFLLGRKRFHWESADTTGEVIVTPEWATAQTGELLYEWKKIYHIQETSHFAIDEIQSSITEGTIIETAQTFYERVWPIIMWIFTRKKRQKTDYSEEPASAICDGNGNVTAIIYQSEEPAYRIVRKDLQNDSLLHVFCLKVLEGGIV